MLQTYNPQLATHTEDRGQALDLAHYVRILKRRVFYFLIPFVLLLIAGFFISAIQRPIYHSEGKILVESPEIPTDLVRPTVTASANERIQVIEQRIMNRDNLVAVVNKFGLFATQQQWMSGTQLLDLMRDRTQIKLVDSPARQNNAIAFTLSFEYETPDLAMKVANEFLTMILNEDARSRSNHAAETTKFLEREVKRLQGEFDSIEAQIVESKRQPLVDSDDPDERKVQMTALATMKAELLQKASVYTSEHPDVKVLKKKIAALEQSIAQTAKANHPTEVNVDSLERQRLSVESSLDDANKKLTTARLGETMERDQQSEHLEVIEQPAVPQKPVRPNRLKLFAISFALASMAGIGAVFAAELLDKSIRGSHELAGVVDGHLIVAIPYISTPHEDSQNRRKVILLSVSLAVVLLVGLVAALLIGISIDFSWFDRSWIDVLTRLSK